MRMHQVTRHILPLLAFLFMQAAHAELIEIDEQDLRDSAAQGLLWTDKITGSELTGSNAYSTPFTFYRMGLDGQLAINANMSKLQLGCGGVNDLLNPSAGCDIDIDYVSMMGRNGNAPGNPLSAFTMERPYVEIAVKNDGTANREVAGIKIGAQSVDGAMSVGRRYATNGSANQENTLGWTDFAMDAANGNIEPTRQNGAACNPSASRGAAVTGCNSGINSVSGFLGTEMSLSMYVQTRVCVFICIGVNEWGCVGRTAFYEGAAPAGCHITGQNGATEANEKANGMFADLGGTRMQFLGLRNVRLFMTDNPLIDLLGGEAFASMNADLRVMHFITFNNTSDFFISFQREPIAYPRYSKMTPTAQLAALDANYLTKVDYVAGDDMFMDACATTRYDSARCASAYSVPANTGWWLNAPSVKLMEIYNPSVNLGDVNLGQALSLLGAPGLLLTDPNFNTTPSKNCYGATKFC